MDITISQFASYSQAQTVVPAPDEIKQINQIAWDSRFICPGDAFVAFGGEHHDGNDFILEAIGNGAIAVIATRPPTQEEVAAATSKSAILTVADGEAIAAFQRIAERYRQTLTTTQVIGITGSSGKTTTKDLIAAVLETSYKTTATAGNYNNEIGLPATIFAANKSTEMLVCEMGMQSLGEIARLAEIAAPRIGVITNIGVAHCEILGSKENIARAKTELIEALPMHSGIAILNGDDAYTPFVRELAQTAANDIKVILYGLGSHNDIRATQITYDSAGRAGFDLWLPDGRPRRAQLALQGEHNVLNALAAAATGMACGVAPDAILEALAAAKPASMRQEVHETKAGVTVVDDTYNANPDSMRAALSLLARLPRERMHIAVLGDMYELGSEEQEFHSEIGAFAHINHLDLLVTVGELGACIAKGAIDVGMPEDAVIICANLDEAELALRPYLSRKPIILVKASRGMHLEQLVSKVLDLC